MDDLMLIGKAEKAVADGDKSPKVDTYEENGDNVCIKKMVRGVDAIKAFFDVTDKPRRPKSKAAGDFSPALFSPSIGGLSQR
jgi:hypothetical protein